MKAITWHGKHDVRHETVDDPAILNPRDAGIRHGRANRCGHCLDLCFTADVACRLHRR